MASQIIDGPAYTARFDDGMHIIDAGGDEWFTWEMVDTIRQFVEYLDGGPGWGTVRYDNQRAVALAAANHIAACLPPRDGASQEAAPDA